MAANSKGKPFINKATIARQNRKTALLRSNFSEFSPLLQLQEDLFLVIAAFLAISDILRPRKTCSYANQLCTSNFLWKRLVKRDFPDFLVDSVLSNSLLAYKLFYNAKLSTESHRAQLSDFVEQLNARERKLLEENELINHRLADLQARLQILHNDADQTTPVTKLQEQVNYISLSLKGQCHPFLVSL